MKANAAVTRDSGEPFHLRTEVRSKKPHPYCHVCANDDDLDDAVLDLPKLNLPRLRGNCALVTTKLGETVSRSTVGHVFELSIPMENPSPPEYNCLHDPHLKAFFEKRCMRSRLLADGYITPTGHVLCSLKEYNTYQHFLESEFSKFKQLRENVLVGHSTDKQEQGKVTRHLAEERRRVLAQRQREVREMQHSAKMDAIQDRRDRKELATMKLEAEKRAKTRGGVNLVPGTMLVEQDRKDMLQTTAEGQSMLDHEEELGGGDGHLLRKKRVLFLLKKYNEERQRADSSHTRALALKGEADQIQKRMQEAKARQLDRWRVHFSKLQKRWRTMVDSAIQPLGGDPPKDQPLTPSLSAKNSLIHHHTRISSRDPRRKISVANTPKPTQCVRFNMEPEVHLFSKDVGGHDDDGGLGTGVSEHGETSAQEEGVVVRDLEPVGVAV